MVNNVASDDCGNALGRPDSFRDHSGIEIRLGNLRALICRKKVLGRRCVWYLDIACRAADPVEMLDDLQIFGPSVYRPAGYTLSCWGSL